MKKDVQQVKGMVLTGWSRFDHFAVLCELMSTGIPSLAVDLQLIQNGGRIKKAYQKARELLQCDISKEVNLPEMELLVNNQSFAHTHGTPPVPKLTLGTTECSYPGNNNVQNAVLK